MIAKADIISFFNNCAPTWDENTVTDREKIETILDNAGVSEGKNVLDIACGTGVLIPFYLERNVASVTGVDISPHMVALAEGKFTRENVRFFCMDAEEELPEGRYDSIVIYNAFPHFPDPKKLLRNLCSALAPGGTVTVAHGMGRETIDRHHRGAARDVSLGLMESGELRHLISVYADVTVVVDTEEMYQIAARKQPSCD